MNFAIARATPDKRSTGFGFLFLALMLAAILPVCANGAANTVPLIWTGDEKRVVLVAGSSRPAIARLEAHMKSAGIALVIANAATDSVESVYGPCLDADPGAYVWLSNACLDPVRMQYRADYALFLTVDAAKMAMSLVDLNQGGVVWSQQAQSVDSLLANAPF